MKLMAIGATAAKNPPDTASSNKNSHVARAGAPSRRLVIQPIQPTAAADMSIHFAK
jgi:hypothetical protein